MNKFLTILIGILLFITIDIYVFQAVKVVTQSFSTNKRIFSYYVFWSITLISIVAFITYPILPNEMRIFILTGLFINYFSKLLIVFFLLIDDFSRFIRWIYQKGASFFSTEPILENTSSKKISRSTFLSQAGLFTASVPVLGMTYGILVGAHDYRIRRQIIKLSNLPDSFHGMRIIQLSDIHAGSFFNRTAVKRGIEMILREKADIIFFTGDLVNNRATEMREYVDVFGRIKAPLGVYSILGNHDYGDYVSWKSKQEKQKNLKNLKNIHKTMGWKLLVNEHEMLERNGKKIAVLGTENWSAKKRFPKYGKLQKAYEGTQEAAVRCLLSHDPSHWDAEIKPNYPDIDITFSGHTHGMQFGVKIYAFQWSPVQYIYKQWAGLYQDKEQYLYVNRGFGYIGFPARIGMPPEITVIELHRS